MNCPKCGSPMSCVLAEGEELAVCSGCHTTREINQPGNPLVIVAIIVGLLIFVPKL